MLAACVDSSQPPGGISVFRSSSLFDTRLPAERRLEPSLDFPADAIHIHQVDDPKLVNGLRRRAPVLLSAHAYTACTSGVHYFKPGEECQRAHGPGCVAGLMRGCAHTRRPQTLPGAYRRAAAGLAALLDADMAISYSAAVDQHLAINGVSRRAVVPLFSTLPPATTTPSAGAERRVLFAGRVVAPKGVGVLIRAARDVDAEFVICGDGWRLEAMRARARRLGVQDRVRFCGWLDAEQLRREIGDASVVALPSLWPEPFGLVGLEALAAGRPVVASATGGVGDWLQDGVTGLAVKPGDHRALACALEQLLSEPARREEMGLAGRRIVAARFSAEHHVAALSAAYRIARVHWESQRQAR